MIKINKLENDEIKEYVNIVCNKLYKSYEISKKSEIPSKYKDIVHNIFQNCESIVGSEIKILVEIYEKLQKTYPEYLMEMSDENPTNSQKDFNNYIKDIFEYKTILKQDIIYKLIEKLSLNVCPYCNRNYISTVNKKRKKRADLDHFYPKSKFPILSLSIYNLIPSCSYCNTLKRDKVFTLTENLYPYEEGIEEIQYFDYKLNSLSEISIELKKNINKKMDNNAYQLLLDDLYQSHTDIVKNIIENSQKYNDIYCSEINQLIGIKGKRQITTQEIKYFLGYTDKNKTKDTPLGKLKNDIIDSTYKIKK